MASKRRKEKKESKTPKESIRPPKKGATLVKGIVFLALLGGLLWGLMKGSTASNNMVPYNQIEKTSAEVKDDRTPSEPDPADRETSLDPDDEVVEEIRKEEKSPDLAMKPSDFTVPESPLPREALEHIAKAMDLTEKGRGNAADLQFQKAARVSPDSPELYSIWGAALRMQEKYPAANEKFARAHELAPEDAEITFNWGFSLLEEQNADQAIEQFLKTVELDPENFLAYNYLGKAYGQKNMYSQEAASYRKAIALNPDFPVAHFNLGVVLGLQKKFEQAAPHFEKAIALDKSFEKPFVVQLLTALGRYKKKPETETEAKDAPPVQEAKAAETTPPNEAKRSERSEHNMEGSKTLKNSTRVAGQILINGRPMDPKGVVFLETQNKLPIPDQKPMEVKIHQKGLQFFPKHTVVPVDSTVTFVNDDLEVHNIYSKSDRNQFNLGAMAAGSSKSLHLTNPGPIILRCNMHKDMVGTLFVVPNGYYTHPNENGEYSFDHVKNQGYLLQFWHPRLEPQVIEANLKTLELTGEDKEIDFNLKSNSRPGEIHDMVDTTDYNEVVDNIEKEVFQAIEDWKAGMKSLPHKRMLMAITKHFDGGGLKDAIAKSFSERRSKNLEKKLDDIRKKIAGFSDADEPVTEGSLKQDAKFAISQLRLNVQELEARLNPDFLKDAKKN